MLETNIHWDLIWHHYWVLDSGSLQKIFGYTETK